MKLSGYEFGQDILTDVAQFDESRSNPLSGLVLILKSALELLFGDQAFLE